MSKKKSPRKKARVPSLRHCNGRGFVELNGVRNYLGPWGAPETTEAYQREIAQWLEGGRRLPVSRDEITVTELCDRYFEHAASYYRRPDGTNTTTMDAVSEAVHTLRRLYGRTPVSGFGPLALRAVRQEWINRDLSRTTVNKYAQHARAVFRWGTGHELVPATVLHGLSAVEGLRRGRSETRETDPVRPVSEGHIGAVKEHVSRQVWTMIQLQRLTAARAGEVVGLRPCDIDTDGDVWAIRLAEHKTAHKGRTRTLFIGPRAQAMLRPYMLRPTEAPLFSPCEAAAERNAKAESHRRPNQKPNPRKTDRTLGPQYTVASYRRAIARACVEVEIDVWTPHQLRHTAATEIRRTYGLEGAQVALGHASADVTQVYAERDERIAMKIAQEVG